MERSRSDASSRAGSDSRPALQFQSCDALKFLNVVRHQRETAGERLARDEQIVRADGSALPFQVGANPRGGFRRHPIQREFDDGGDKSLDFLPQSVGATWLNRCTMPGRCRSTPMQVSVSSKWVMAVRLQVSHGWQLTLLWTLERGVGHMDGFKESFRPCCWLCRLEHNRLAVLTDDHVCRQVYALGQANGLAISVEDDNCCFHAGEFSQNPRPRPSLSRGDFEEIVRGGRSFGECGSLSGDCGNISRPDWTYRCAWHTAPCALRPGRKP